MNRTLIIADDLTGALDSCIKFTSKGLNCRVFLYNQLDNFEINGYDVVAIDTESRHLTQIEAFNRVLDITKRLKDDFNTIYKKTDSILRGNVGSELEAVLKATAIKKMHFVPAYPNLGRTTINGIQLINNKPISESEYAKDRLNTIKNSNIIDLIHEQSEVICGNNEIKEGIVVWDCANNEDLKNIAKTINDNNETHLLGGCAGFLEEYANLLPDKNICQAEFKSKNLVVICGSVNLVSTKQIEYVESIGANRIQVAFKDLYFNNEAVIKNIKEQVNESIKNNKITTIEVIQDKENDSYESLENKIVDGLSKITEALLSTYSDLAYMVIGGDTLMGVIDKLKIESIIPENEIDSGTIISKCSYNKKIIRIISKSGGFGQEDLIQRIFEKVSKGVIDGI